MPISIVGQIYVKNIPFFVFTKFHSNISVLGSFQQRTGKLKAQALNLCRLLHYCAPITFIVYPICMSVHLPIFPVFDMEL